MWQRELDLNGLDAVAECFRNSEVLRNRAALTIAVMVYCRRHYRFRGRRIRASGELSVPDDAVHLTRWRDANRAPPTTRL